MCQSTTTSAHSQSTLWDESISSPEASRASLTVSPGSDAARQMTVTSGRKWLALLPKSDRVSSLLRTLLASSRWHSTTVLLTWKASATPAGRLYFRLAPSTPRTAETAFGSLLPTPTMQNSKHGAATDWEHENRPGHLHVMATRLLIPTPRTEGFDAGRHRGATDSLHSWAKALLPTPTHRDHKSGTGADHGTHSPPLSSVMGGTLNPEFVEWMMGYPEGWTDLTGMEDQ